MSNLGILEKINYYKQYKTFDTKHRNKINEDDFIVAKIEKENKNEDGYIYLTKNGFEEIQKKEDSKELIVPILDRLRERWVLYCASKSGDGKGVFVADMTAQYHFMLPENKIYYICQSSIKDDISFSKIHHYIKQLDIKAFEDKSEDYILKNLQDSLIILDDNDNLEDDERHTLQSLQKTILFLGRKFRISLFKISHYKSDAHNTRALIPELDYYITFVNRDLKNDRLLKEYKKITKKDILELSSSLWCFFDFKYEYVVSNKKVFFLE